MKRILSLVLISLFTANPALNLVFANDTGWRSPKTLEGATTIDVPTAIKLHAEGVPFVDVRSDRQFKKRHIPGAHHLYIKTTLSEETLAQVAGGKDQWVVIYCNGPHCSLSSKAIRKAVGWGFTKIYYFRAGFRNWRLAGNPLEYGMPGETTDKAPSHNQGQVKK